MNQKIKFALREIAKSLPAIEYKNQKILREVFGWEIIEETKKQAIINNMTYVHPTQEKDEGNGMISQIPIKPHKKYYYKMGNRPINHYDELVKIFRQAKWPGVQMYQEQVRKVYSQVNGKP